jgi:TetR/AcrR family transcriptional regulator, cholesterol catabolism regulator
VPSKRLGGILGGVTERTVGSPTQPASPPSERRAALVALAAELFAERGYRATTVREIADAAGVLSGSLYHHFDSKESIIDELLSSYLDELLAQYRATVSEGGRSIEVLSRLVQAAFSSFDRHRAAITVFQNEREYLLNFPRFSYLAKSEQAVSRIWMKVIREGIATGELRRGLDPKLAHRYIRDAIWVAVRWYRPGGRLSSSQLAEQYLTLMLDGMRSPPAGVTPTRTKRSLG